MIIDYTQRFPTEKEKYKKKTGSLLPHRIGQILRDLGFKAEIHKIEANGADLRIFDDVGNPIVVGEILNWSLRSWMNEKRKTKIINNLSKHSCSKVLIYTTMGHEDILKELRQYDISTVRIGYQILPKFFYDFYAHKDQIKLRRIDSRKTTEEVKLLLNDYLQSIKLKDRSLANEFLVEETKCPRL